MSVPTRRRFLGQAACAGLQLTGVLSTLGTLRLFNATLSAQGLPDPGPAAPGDFKALVCLFLYGGNDGNNVIIPRDATGYATYARERGILALPRDGLVPLTLPAGDGRDFGLHPAMAPLAPAFAAGRLAVVANVGTLVAPITKAEYLSGGAAIPPYLFSHNDQQVQWQTSVPDNPRKIGWGGRLADLLQALNAGSQLSMNVSLAGQNFFQVGQEVLQYQMGLGGPSSLEQLDATWTPLREQYAALRQLLATSYGHAFEQQYLDTFQRSVATSDYLKGVLAAVPAHTNLFPRSTNPETGQLNFVAAQLRMILRTIAAQQTLGMRRQIYFAALGGFDTHDAQLEDHAALLGQLAAALADFNDATAALGFADRVTTFTASDFNRTYGSNGKGSDHAWGNHQFVLGGAVRGGRLYGSMPVLALGGPSDTGDRGAWIPTISTDEYSATLARWFGVADADLPLVLPNIRRFAHADLGFMT